MVELRHVGKRFGERSVLEGIDLCIEPGEFVAIVGRSGCGKSTLLRLVARLIETASAGLIALDGEGSALQRPDMRIMFQDAPAALEARARQHRARPDRARCEGTRPRRVGPASASSTGPTTGRPCCPAANGGGWRSPEPRARARLLLLDEPLGALDALTRIEMQQLIETCGGGTVSPRCS